MEYYQKIKKEFINNNTNKEVKEYYRNINDKNLSFDFIVNNLYSQIKRRSHKWSKNTLINLFT